jgi:hypothetical protein
MSTIGNTGIGGSADLGANSYATVMGPYTVASAGNLTSMSVRIQSGGNARFGVYSNVGGHPSVLLASSASTAVGSPASPIWLTLDMTAPLAVSAGQVIWLAFICDADHIYYHTPGTDDLRYDQSVGTTLPNPLGAFEAEVADWRNVSMYATVDAAVPAAPTNLACGAVTATTIALTWDDNADDEDGFHLQYDIVNTFTAPVQIDLDSADTETDTVLSLAPETEYFFRVRAYNGDGNSDWSNTDSATTAADVTPPTASSWTVPSAGTTVTATLSESGCTPASGTGGFSLSVGSATVSNWAISGTTLTLTLSGTIYAGQTVEVSYDNAGASEAIADASDNLLADITDADVTNNSTVEPAEGTAGALIGAFGFGFGF